MLSRILTILGEGFRLLRVSLKAARYHHKDYFRVVERGIYLGLKKAYSPQEAYMLGLLDPDLPDAETEKCCSKRALVRIQARLNPYSWLYVTEDKAIFYRHCMALGVPIPALYAFFYKKSSGWSFNQEILDSRKDWEKFFEEVVPPEFILKPAWGAYGEGVKYYKRSGGGLVDGYGKSTSARKIYEEMVSGPYEGFVIQEFLKSHPELARLSGTPYLQTLRIATLVDSRLKPHILYSGMKIIAGKNIIDNFEYGRTGNLFARVEHDGTLTPAVTFRSDGPGNVTFHEHPDTGVRIDGFRIPRWKETVSLAEETAVKFLPIRFVGWDVAITPNGSFIVEGNMWSDPANLIRIMDEVLASIREKS